jgi:hypothetical protein
MKRVVRSRSGLDQRREAGSVGRHHETGETHASSGVEQEADQASEIARNMVGRWV